MRAEKQSRRAAQLKELYVGLIGWVWVAAVLAAIYFVVKASFFGGSWWSFFGCVAAAWLFYRISVYYMLETQKATHAVSGQAEGGRGLPR